MAIRLLHLAPRASRASSNKDRLIECTFTTVSLASDPPPTYEALSYVWGTSKKKKLIIIDGYPVTITRNLHTTLKDLQLEDAPRTERTHQVSQMKQVYSRASNVTVYLGPK